ncbi:MAG: diguanylate cyclase [Thermomicrobium sp.]|nr:diguanylate cyclase [Thermomicrobium sp.]
MGDAERPERPTTGAASPPRTHARWLAVTIALGSALVVLAALALLPLGSDLVLLGGASLLAALALLRVLTPPAAVWKCVAVPLAAGIVLAPAANLLADAPLAEPEPPRLLLVVTLLLTATALLAPFLGHRPQLVCLSGASGSIAGVSGLALAIGWGFDLADLRPPVLGAAGFAAIALLGLTNLLVVLEAIRLDRAHRRSPLRWAPWAALGTGLLLTALSAGVLAQWQANVLRAQTRTEAIAAASHAGTILNNRLARLAPERVPVVGVNDETVPGLLWYGQRTATGWQTLFVAQAWEERTPELQDSVSTLRLGPHLASPALLRVAGPDQRPLLAVGWQRDNSIALALLDPPAFFAPTIQAAVLRGTAIRLFLNGEEIAAAGTPEPRAPRVLVPAPVERAGFGLLRVEVQLGPGRAQPLMAPFPQIVLVLGLVASWLLAFALLVSWREVQGNERLRTLSRQLLEEIDERKTIERLLAEREAWLQATLRQLPAIVWTVDRDLVFTSSEGSGLAHLGLKPGQVVGRSLYEYFGTDDPDYLPIRLHRLALAGDPQEYEFHTNGRHYRVRLEPLRTKSGDIEGVIGIAFDVTEQVRAQQELERLATSDGLTGLANRLAVVARLEELIRTGRPFAALLIDLDGFKAVNDSLGHLAGDALLREVAERLRRSVRSEDTAGRLGGDEFLVVAPLRDREAARELAARLLVALAQPFRIEGRTVSLGASIGIVLCSEERPCSPTEVLRNADLALYEAKRRGKGRVVLYHEQLAEEATQELSLAQELRQAIEHRRIGFVGLPIVHLPSGKLAGFEVTPCWVDVAGTQRSGRDLATIAENAGADLWLARESLLEACRWLELLPESTFVVVGFPSRALLDPETWSDLERAPSGLSTYCTRLWLDLPMATLARPGIEREWQPIVARRVGVLVRDPSLAPASIEPLLRLPKAGLRVPEAFVRAFLTQPHSAAVARAIVQVARDLGLVSFAEGIDELAHLVALARSGCQFGQGPLFGPPRHREDAAELAHTVLHWGALAASDGEGAPAWHNETRVPTDRPRDCATS